MAEQYNISSSIEAAAMEAAMEDGLMVTSKTPPVSDEVANLKKEGLRRGKWTPEEETYANRLIYEFKLGLLPLTDGTTLRTFLSKLLNCDPMRISKKFTRQNCIGKQVFRRRQQDLDKITPEQLETSRKELADLEKKFLERVAQTVRKTPVSMSSTGKGRDGFNDDGPVSGSSSGPVGPSQQSGSVAQVQGHQYSAASGGGVPSSHHSSLRGSAHGSGSNLGSTAGVAGSSAPGSVTTSVSGGSNLSSSASGHTAGVPGASAVTTNGGGAGIAFGTHGGPNYSINPSSSVHPQSAGNIPGGTFVLSSPWNNGAGAAPVGMVPFVQQGGAYYPFNPNSYPPTAAVGGVVLSNNNGHKRNAQGYPTDGSSASSSAAGSQQGMGNSSAISSSNKKKPKQSHSSSNPAEGPAVVHLAPSAQQFVSMAGVQGPSGAPFYTNGGYYQHQSVAPNTQMYQQPNNNQLMYGNGSGYDYSGLHSSTSGRNSNSAAPGMINNGNVQQPPQNSSGSGNAGLHKVTSMDVLNSIAQMGGSTSQISLESLGAFSTAGGGSGGLIGGNGPQRQVSWGAMNADSTNRENGGGTLAVSASNDWGSLGDFSVLNSLGGSAMNIPSLGEDQNNISSSNGQSYPHQQQQMMFYNSNDSMGQQQNNANNADGMMARPVSTNNAFNSSSMENLAEVLMFSSTTDLPGSATVDFSGTATTSAGQSSESSQLHSSGDHQVPPQFERNNSMGSQFGEDVGLSIEDIPSNPPLQGHHPSSSSSISSSSLIGAASSISVSQPPPPQNGLRPPDAFNSMARVTVPVMSADLFHQSSRGPGAKQPQVSGAKVSYPQQGQFQHYSQHIGSAGNNNINQSLVPVPLSRGNSSHGGGGVSDSSSVASTNTSNTRNGRDDQGNINGQGGGNVHQYVALNDTNSSAAHQPQQQDYHISFTTVDPMNSSHSSHSVGGSASASQQASHLISPAKPRGLPTNRSVEDFWLLVNMGDLPQPDKNVLTKNVWSPTPGGSAVAGSNDNQLQD